MAAEGKELAGPIIGLIGSILLLISGFLTFVGSLVAIGFLSILTLLIGVVGIIGASIGLGGKKDPEPVLMLIAGLVGVIGMFIPITIFTPYYRQVMLVYPFIFIDPFLVLLGGILGLLLFKK
jgi:hypothetical protein